MIMYDSVLTGGADPAPQPVYLWKVGQASWPVVFLEAAK